MGRTDRRELLRLALGASLLPVLASQRVLAQGVAANSAAGTITPPRGSMIYRRTMQRGLPGGAILLVSRDFQVRFAPLEEHGFMLDGQQVRAAVDAPASLAQMARLEEQRVERGLFPLTLDRAGRIVSEVYPGPDARVAEALAALRQHLAQGGADDRALLASLPADGHLQTAEVPADLFAPAEAEVEQRQTIALPWGDQGEVAVRFAATRDPATGLMRRASREVITTLAGEQRRAAEQWELFPA